MQSCLKKKDRDNKIELLSEAILEQKRKNDILYLLLGFLTFYGLGISYFIYLYQYIQSENSLYLHAGMAIVVCLFCNICLERCYDLASISKKEAFKIFNIPLLILYIGLGYFFCQRIHNTFLLTNNLDNIENIQVVLKEKYPHSKNEILYFNDKYIFIDVTDTLKLDMKTKKAKKKIHIMELEKLFQD